MQAEPPKIRHNVVLFGETGVGKSSVINMLLGTEEATVSPNALGCTLSSTGYEGAIGEQNYTFWDTIGLNEGDQGKVPNMTAVTALYHLLKSLSNKGGVSLLVFCMRSPRITDAGHKNWLLFRDIICQGRVPTVLAVTHLDSQEAMDGWWSENEQAFVGQYGICPSKEVQRVFSGGEDIHSDDGVACITATKGKFKRGHYVNEEEYEESCVKIRRLVFEFHSPYPWKVNPVAWFNRVVEEVDRKFLCFQWKGQQVRLEAGQAIEDLMSRWKITEAQAKEVAGKLEGGGRGLLEQVKAIGQALERWMGV
ncbi:hypothetical protein FA13DRAFT_111745 [Coprinellus micaceus]|uniref:G domain-containing protein n=1 Tax=Coprinellus micaceus TaxID=71717 RepID=A0A4Y7THY2_COPMI|nr:hypothetical protein FA13DRAFT_111745 [Coprinellus micaceus]